MIKKLFLIILPLFLFGCISENPGTQCLNSFKATLKDPDSGKVLSFDPPTLKYSATNSYGARTQGKALCTQQGVGKWTRDQRAEYLAILELSAAKLKTQNACVKTGGTSQACAGNSTVLSLSAISLTPVNVDKLNEESAAELGF
jgi:hypothetical protein